MAIQIMFRKPVALELFTFRKANTLSASVANHQRYLNSFCSSFLRVNGHERYFWFGINTGTESKFKLNFFLYNNQSELIEAVLTNTISKNRKIV